MSAVALHQGPPTVQPHRRRRAGLVLAGSAVAVVLVAVALVAFLLGAGSSTPPTPGVAAPRVSPPAGRGAAPGPVGAAPDPGAGGWDVAAETTLATAPMLTLPDSAALPHTLSTVIGGPPLHLPAPGQTAGRVVAAGFPDTAEGAVAQLAALTETGLAGGDPAGYALAYRSVALPGAPPPETTPLYTGMAGVRAAAQLPATGAAPSLVFSYRTLEGLIKGSTDGGQYTVVCVLGELTAGINGQSVSGGAGDCQALRYTLGQWWISPGAAAARSPLAWPGTAEAAAAGYRAVH